MRRLPRPLTGRRRALLWRLIANGIAQGGASGAFALGVRALLDSRRALSPAWGVFAVLALSVLVSGGLRWLERVDAERLGQSYAHQLRLRVFDHLASVAPARLRRLRQGQLALRFVGDMTVLRTWVSRGLARVWVAAAMCVGALAVLATLDPRFALVVACALALGAGAAYACGDAIEASVRRARRRRGRFAAALVEQLRRLPTIQAYARRDAERASAASLSRRQRDAAVMLATRSGAMLAIVVLATGFASLGVIAVAHGMANAGTPASRGTLLAALLLVSLLSTPLHRLGRVHEQWRSSRVAHEKLARLLQSGPTIRNAGTARPLPRGQGRVAVRGFALPDGAATTFEVSPGERVRIEAASVEAVTSLLWAMPRLREVPPDTIRIDGQDIVQTTLGALRRNVVLVSGDLPLIRGSLRDNLCYRVGATTPDAIDCAIDRCALRDVVERLPRGLDARLGDDGYPLTVAERWRVRWARALLGRPRTLLFEDVHAQWQGGNRDAFFAMLDGFDGSVLMGARVSEAWPEERPVRRIVLPAAMVARPADHGGSAHDRAQDRAQGRTLDDTQAQARNGAHDNAPDRLCTARAMHIRRQTNGRSR